MNCEQCVKGLQVRRGCFVQAHADFEHVHWYEQWAMDVLEDEHVAAPPTFPWR